jgi:uroporphyrinogen-III synthase
MRVTIPETMKYFCITESVALYLQKYIVYRKRKIFYGNNTFQDLLEVIQKHKEEKFLVPLSDVHKPEIPKTLDKAKLKYNKVILYKTITSDLSDLGMNYDMLVFYSPNEIKSLFDNFPDFEQGEIKVAAFGPTTAKAVKDGGLRLDIHAPTPACTSMTQALEEFIKKHNKDNK